jgi:phosphatidate cytidylyltransferase
VADVDPVSGHSDRSAPVAAGRSNLALRIGSAAVLAPLAVAAAYFGGWPFAAFWALAAAAVWWEWNKLVAGAVWTIAGIGYAGVMLLAPVILRADADLGFFAILFLFAIVWTTDILGYFAGRAFGGPKLMPAISPKKTWSGAIAGTLGAIIVGSLAVRWYGTGSFGAAMVITLLLSVMAQLGDLLESWIKRRFGAKDAGHIIPGHGGVMDRLDGFWAAALVAAAIGVAHGGIDSAARGLLVW